jgi:hypothetical protein
LQSIRRPPGTAYSLNYQLPPNPEDEAKRDRAGDDANERKGSGIDARLLERGATEERIARERDHGQEGQEKNSCRFHAKMM